ncbi:cell wall protein DAN4-like [Bombus bifarius]|uniref:Cell wall protein DAN4-like n=1 Tax=Bombus bifarius TaxID=103933 RepID=A0A6P8MLM2_9HYME|nr:cell wall protein DAN4-like [Bombus bifarius]
MRLVYITCVLLATAICSIAADNAATTQGDTKSINQQTVDLVNSTASIKNSSSPAALVKDSSTNVTKNADVNDNITSIIATIPATNTTISNKTKTDTAPDNDHGAESTNSTTTTITSTPTTSSITTKQTPTPENSTSTTIVTPTTTNNTTPIVSSTPITTPVPSSTKIIPSYTQRHFDGLSFLGGIILATCLMAISFVTWKVYRAFNEQNYRTL